MMSETLGCKQKVLNVKKSAVAFGNIQKPSTSKKETQGTSMSAGIVKLYLLVRQTHYYS